MVVTSEQCLQVRTVWQEIVKNNPEHMLGNVFLTLWDVTEDLQKRLAAANLKIDLLESVEQPVLVSPDVASYLAAMGRKEGV